MRKEKKILILSFYFAPSAMVGGKRFTFLSKIIQENYPELHVLTLREKYFTSRDDSLSSVGVIHHTGMYPPYTIKNSNIFKRIFNRLWWDGYLCFVDPYSGWILPGLLKSLRIIKDKKIDLVIATGPPFSSMVIGLLLNLVTGVELILDYRDPWTNFDSKFYRNVWVKKINDFLERVAIRRASALVFCTRVMKDNFIKKLGKYTKAASYVVTNGFHSTDNIQPLSLGKNRKNMVDAGAFYGERKIRLLAEPIHQLLKEGVINKDNFCFHIFGELKNDDRAVIGKYDLQDVIIEHPIVPHKQLLRYLKAADVLVLMISNKMSYSISYKFYDYLSVRKPILAIVPENAAMEQVMKEVDCGRYAFINSKESILQNLRAMLSESKEYTFSGGEQYTWDELGRKYIEIINKVGCCESK